MNIPEPIMQIIVGVVLFVLTGTFGIIGANTLKALKTVNHSIPQIIESLALISKATTSQRQTSKLLARSITMLGNSMKAKGFNSTLDEGLRFAAQAEACVDGSADKLAEAAIEVG